MVKDIQSVSLIKSHKGPLSEEEVEERIYTQIQIIDDEANKEINMMSIQTTDSTEVVARELATEPKEQIDEWVEKVRAYTDRQTLIHSTRVRRLAKLRVLEAFGNMREVIKNEARERIKEKMTGNSKECEELIGRMLYQGLVRLMEPTVLVHTTKYDIKKVEKHYSWASKKYQEETNVKVKLVTSKHPLKSSYYGRIVLSDKKSTVFVDVNLHKNVDLIADEVFTQIAAAHGKYKNPMVIEIKQLRSLSYFIMPRGPSITNARLETILSTMHGDPRTQIPTICIIEESRKKLLEEPEPAPPPMRLNRRKVTIPFVTPPTPGGPGGQSEPMMSVVPAKYMFRQQEDDSSGEVARASKDLYNLENALSSMELNQNAENSPGTTPSAIWKNMAPKAKAMAQSSPGGGARSRPSRTATRPAPRGDAARASTQITPEEKRLQTKPDSRPDNPPSPDSVSAASEETSARFSRTTDESRTSPTDSGTIPRNSANENNGKPE